MPELNFISSVNPDLYVAQQASGDSFWVAFLPLDAKSVGAASILFGDTLKFPGTYIFSATAPTDLNTFTTNAQKYLASVAQQYQQAAVAWFTAPDADMNANNVLMLYFQGANNGYGLLTNFNFNFGNAFATLTISAAAMPTITLDTDNNRIVFVGPQGGVSLITYTANNNTSQVVTDTNLELPFTGSSMGSLRFLATLNQANDFKSFDTASKYFYNDNTTEQLMEMSYPEFAGGSLNQMMQFQVAINPIDLLNQQQLSTYMAFLGTTLVNSVPSPTLLTSNFRTDYGLPINLIPNISFSTVNGSNNIPTAESAVLVFSERDPGNPADNWYTIPSGYYQFGINASEESYLDSNKQIRLLCGLSGTESVSITPQSSLSMGDFVSFKGKLPAFVPQFPILQSGNKVGSNTTQKPLSNNYLTAWAGVVKNTPNSDNVYHSQPQGSSLYTVGSSGANGQFLNYFLSNSGTLNEQNVPTIYFPMVAYGTNTVLAPRASAPAFELQILAPQRKLLISTALTGQAAGRAVAMAKSQALLKGGTNDCTPETCYSTTSPQGFFLQVDKATSVWKNLKLASNQFTKSDGTESPVYTLEFNSLDPKLQSALQTNQLFLVASANVNNVLGDFANSMEIEEWPFDLKVPTPDPLKPNTGQYSNVVIFKYCGQSLQDRVKNVQFWTNPEDFNDTANNGLPNLSGWISNYIQRGIDKFNAGDTDYAKFYNIATNPDWKGVIALKVDISLTTFPAELQGLLAGIDLSEFNAHHFGIDLSVVNNDGGTLSMAATSSLFALIDYEDTLFQQFNSDIELYKSSAPINTSVDYLYNVLLLKVLFVNSKIASFNSYIAFTVNKLFGETVIPDTRDNLLILNGTYENHNGVPSYTFSATGSNILSLDSVILQDVEILKANFVTTVSQDNSGTVLSRFSFFGYLNFFSLEGFDLMSFGSETTDPPLTSGRGISFSNMYIDLTFPLSTPTSQVFTFDIGSMAFDIGASYSREASLYRHFPLQLTGITSGTVDNSPASQGYLNIQLPSLQQQDTISGDWYGLVFKLNMGTLGSLASAAGFNTTFLACWNVGGEGAVAGLRLPGVNPQAPTLSLQGVLRLEINSISLTIADDGVSYLMKMNNIALKVLSLTFPPGGQIGFFLFGNPSSSAPPESLGWYAAYQKK
ncbi:MAG: hypothetical protein PSV16_04935 [Flavobacterium sp.]|nr:hypothetical protein [Flavobacterium sp.]